MERGWNEGTVIRSSEWSFNRKIRAVGERFVTTKILTGRCGTSERVRSFPKDIYEVAA
jgi:hypothetical protein